jgi:hypothetical protein
MRITVHLDTFNGLNPNAYAVLWLDKEAGQWSREGHAGIELPPWGRLADDGRSTLIRGAEGLRALCVLEGLKLGSQTGPRVGDTGEALWYAPPAGSPIPGRWHVQFVDLDIPHPEHGVFADPGYTSHA